MCDACADPTSDLACALDLADLADSLSLQRFRATDLLVESKPDLTPVTDADRAVEDALRARLGKYRPDDAILGEERGTQGHSTRCWIIDPIDGTKNFVRGVPVWATLIALVVDSRVELSVVSAPALGRRWWAQHGLGAWTQALGQAPSRIHVSAVGRVEDASLSYSSLSGWFERGLGEAFVKAQSRFWRTRAYGDFWSYMLLAEGAVDAACEPELELYDMAALVPIVTEAGGRFTDFQGNDGPWGGCALATNALLHDELLTLIAP